MTDGDLIDALAERLAPKVAEILRREQRAPELVSQTDSPLGPRRHCAAVRRRMGAGEGGASKVGRRYLLTREALAEELHRLGQSEPQPRPEPDADEQLAQELGFTLSRKSA